MNDPKRDLNSAELLDLFKHWDTRTSHHELLNITIAAAAIGAVAAGWDKITACATLAVALGSISLYVLNILAIRRFGLFQDNIFDKLEKDHFSDWKSVVFVSNKTLGIRVIRIFGLVPLALIWSLLIYEKLAHKVEGAWEYVFWVLIFGSIVVSTYLWNDKSSK